MAGWATVYVKKTRRDKEPEPGSDSVRTDRALVVGGGPCLLLRRCGGARGSSQQDRAGEDVEDQKPDRDRRQQRGFAHDGKPGRRSGLQWPFIQRHFDKLR